MGMNRRCNFCLVSIIDKKLWTIISLLPSQKFFLVLVQFKLKFSLVLLEWVDQKSVTSKQVTAAQMMIILRSKVTQEEAF